MEKDNTLEKAEPVKGHPVKEKVEKPVDIHKDLTMEEAERRVAEENGEVPEAPESQAEEKKAEEEKAEEPTKKEGEIEGSIPDNYKGKKTEELIKLLQEKENYIQKRSGEIGELKKQAETAEETRKKVEQIEQEIISQEEKKNLKIPQPPEPPTITDDEFYNEPVKSYQKIIEYNKKLAEYNRLYVNSMVNPFYQAEVERKRDKLYQNLEDKYKNHPVKFDKQKIQEYLNKNPQYFTKYKTDAYEKAYHDLSTDQYSEQYSKTKEEIREQVKKELLEEQNTHKQAGNVGLSDLQTQPTGSTPEYDKAKMEDDAEYRDQVIADMEKRSR